MRAKGVGVMRVFNRNGEAWHAELVGASHGSATGQTHHAVRYTRPSDGLALTGHLWTNDLRRAPEADLVTSLDAVPARLGWITTCPKGHEFHPTFSALEFLDAFAGGQVEVHCLSCGENYFFNDTEVDNVVKQIRRGTA